MHGKLVIVAEDRNSNSRDSDVSIIMRPGLHILHSHPCGMFASSRPYDSLLYAPGVIAAGSA